jgi:hypothetical protein
VLAAAPATTVEHQVMVSTGLAAHNPFEAWFVFDKSADPTVPGYAVPAGATIRFTFPKAFTPKPGFLGVVLLTGWAQGSIPAKFTFALDPRDPRSVIVRFEDGVQVGGPDRPGLKAIHVRTSPRIRRQATIRSTSNSRTPESFRGRAGRSRTSHRILSPTWRPTTSCIPGRTRIGSM